MPVKGVILPTVGLPLLHVPPVVASNKVIEVPTQTLGLSIIATGMGITVKVVVAMQPVGNT
jgi:hypothetical protein